MSVSGQLLLKIILPELMSMVESRVSVLGER